MIVTVLGGVISDSTATVIGAMIVAPLMTPILGIVLAVVLTDAMIFIPLLEIVGNDELSREEAVMEGCFRLLGNLLFETRSALDEGLEKLNALIAARPSATARPCTCARPALSAPATLRPCLTAGVACGPSLRDPSAHRDRAV